MKATLCDICGWKIDEGDPKMLERQSEIFELHLERIDPTVRGKSDADVCPDCRRRILESIERLRDENPFVKHERSKNFLNIHYADVEEV